MGKSGSSLLHKMFLKNPDIFVSPDSKELNFFGDNKRWNKGLQWYHNCFREQNNETWIADISPGYHIKEKTLERITETLGNNLKVIFTFRQFTDFAYSRYIQKVRSRILDASFLDELDGKGNFYRQLDEIVANYMEVIGPENMLVMHYERDFDRKAPRFEQKINDFLGLKSSESYYQVNTDKAVNSGSIPRFVYSSDSDYEEVYDNVVYRVPKNRMVYCNGRTYKDIHWENPDRETIETNLAIASKWTTKMDTELYEYVQQKYTLPLADKVERSLGIDLSHWDVGEKEIKYKDAPLPDAYIVEGQAVELAKIPWG